MGRFVAPAAATKGNASGSKKNGVKNTANGKKSTGGKKGAKGKEGGTYYYGLGCCLSASRSGKKKPPFQGCKSECFYL